MTATRTPGVPVIEDGELISTSPASGEEVGRFPVAGPAEVSAAVQKARPAATWWAGLGFAERRHRLLCWRAALARRLPELAELVHRETGKPVAEAIVEAGGCMVSAWADDGTIEALEDPERRFALGVLWHPEAAADARLFEALVAEARAYREERRR